jgi:hypothetical protein
VEHGMINQTRFLRLSTHPTKPSIMQEIPVWCLHYSPATEFPNAATLKETKEKIEDCDCDCF